jgi:hypothetical protein
MFWYDVRILGITILNCTSAFHLKDMDERKVVPIATYKNSLWED